MSTSTKKKCEFSDLKMNYQNSCTSKIATTEKDCLWEEAPPKYLFACASVMTVWITTSKDTIRIN